MVSKAPFIPVECNACHKMIYSPADMGKFDGRSVHIACAFSMARALRALAEEMNKED